MDGTQLPATPRHWGNARESGAKLFAERLQTSDESAKADGFVSFEVEVGSDRSGPTNLLILFLGEPRQFAGRTLQSVRISETLGGLLPGQSLDLQSLLNRPQIPK